MAPSTETTRRSVPPSGAVRAFGFAEVPTVGDILQVVPSEQQAKALAEQFKELGESQRKRNFADLVTRISQGKVTQLKVVLKTDTQGGLEALQSSLQSRATDQVSVKVIHAAIGAVTENDVIMAAASDGLVIAFHVDVPTNVKSTADQHGVRANRGWSRHRRHHQTFNLPFAARRRADRYR